MKDLASFEQVDQIRKTDPIAYQAHALLGLCATTWATAMRRRIMPVRSRWSYSSRIPVLADQPDHEDFQTIREGNSPNHRRRGQNVLFGDGSVRWFHSRMIGPNDPDVYLNNDHQPRPGVHITDSVLMPSKVPFQGAEPRRSDQIR